MYLIHLLGLLHNRSLSVTKVNVPAVIARLVVVPAFQAKYSSWQKKRKKQRREEKTFTTKILAYITEYISGCQTDVTLLI